jgi:hypothetical protein
MKKENEVAAELIGKVLAWILFIIPIGAFLFQFVMWRVFNLDVAWYWDLLGAIFLTRFIAPAAFIVWLLGLYGVNTQLVHDVVEKLQ